MLTLDPKFAAAYTNRGNLHAAQGDRDAALKDYSQAIEANPENATAYNNRALIHSALRQYEEALSDYQQAAKIYQGQGSTQDYERIQPLITELKKRVERQKNQS